MRVFFTTAWAVLTFLLSVWALVEAIVALVSRDPVSTVAWGLLMVFFIVHAEEAWQEVS